MRPALVASLLALLAGCGSSSNSNSFDLSCDTVTGFNHSCYDQTVTGGDKAAAMMTCMQKGGGVVSICSRTGAVGGCQNTVPAFGGTAVTTLWSYTGNTATLMSDCTSSGGTWVVP